MSSPFFHFFWGGEVLFYRVLYTHIIAIMYAIQIHTDSPPRKDTKTPINTEKTEHFQIKRSTGLFWWSV